MSAHLFVWTFFFVKYGKIKFMRNLQTQFIETNELESEIENFKKNGITEFTLNDTEILNHKGKLLKFLKMFSQKAPETLLTLPIKADVLDMDICKAVSELYCTLDIDFFGVSKNGTYLFDKKFYSNRATTLNNLGLLFGFSMAYDLLPGDSVKLFRDRIDFAISLYPNHIFFHQLFDKELKAKPTATFSTQDIQRSSEIANAIETFYSYGRAVTWFLSVLKPLKMSAYVFFQDFAEWQNHNNCGLKSSWKSNEAKHLEIEKMQLKFLKFKYEEKGKSDLFEVVSNIVRINGALSRCYGEGEECEIALSYNPDELLGYGALDIQSFAENSIQENSHIKVFMGNEGPDFKYC